MLCDRFADQTASETDSTSISPSPLLRLPGELRNKIYAYVFRSRSMPSRLFSLQCRTAGRPPDLRHRRLSLIHLECVDVALMRTCRQIRAETRLLPYKYAEYHANSTHFVAWLELIDREALQVVWDTLTEGQREEVLEFTKSGWWRFHNELSNLPLGLDDICKR